MIHDKITGLINDSLETKKNLLADEELLQTVSSCVEVLVHAFRSGNKVYLCGNGGSAADAQHLAAELSGRFYLDRDALPAEALHVNSSYMTAVANDYSYDVVYSRLVNGFGNKGDVLIGLSTSGNSPNIVKAVEAAAQKGMISIGFTGSNGGKMLGLCDHILKVPSDITPRIQECHILLGHIICQLVEEIYFSNSGRTHITPTL